MDPHGALRSSMYITNPNLEDANIANVKRHMLVGRNLGHYTFSRLVSEYPRHPTTIASLVGWSYALSNWSSRSPDARPIPGGKQWTAGAKPCAFSITCGHLRICFADHHWSRDPTIGYDPFFLVWKEMKDPNHGLRRACLAMSLALPTMPRMNHAGVRVGC